MRGWIFPLLLSALCLSSCFVERSGLGGDPCAMPDEVATCDSSGEQLVTCVSGEPSAEPCMLGCTTGAGSCWSCIPETARCDGDRVVTCDATGTEAPSATCAVDACVDDGMGGAECSACMAGTSRCDGATEATIACDSSGREATPVPCGMNEHCEVGGGGMTASCLPNCVEGCAGDDRVTCAPGEVRETCPLGCDMTTVECRVLQPSNVDGVIALDRGTSGLTVGMTAPEILIFDTDDDGRIDRYDPATGERTTIRMAVSGVVDAGIYHEQLGPVGTETPSGATIPGLAVWVMDSLSVGAMGTIHFVGTRAAVVLVEGDVLVEGRISARAEWLRDTDGSPLFVRAPAGGFGDSGQDGGGFGGGDEGVSDSNRRSGGGGGSFGSSGGQGGGAGFGAVPSVPGEVYGDADLVPLYGGSAGGAGSDEVAAGGDGGGALQISAGGTLTVAAGAIIDVSGEGGYGASASRGGGGGGGSGGGLLLEAAVISIAGIIGAPGGGGGGGTSNSSDGTLGDRWDPPGALLGLGGLGISAFAGNGGDGSDDAGGDGGDGETKDDPNGGGGGGGGGAGRVRLNVRPGTTPMVSGTVVPSGALSTEGEVGIR